jgi:hypothetical protein
MTFREVHSAVWRPAISYFDAYDTLHYAMIGQAIGWGHALTFASLSPEIAFFASTALSDADQITFGKGGSPTDAFAIHGSQWIRAAWKARTSQRASQVSRAAFETFFAHLRNAEASMTESLRLDPTNPVAHVNRLISGKGLQIPKDELMQRVRYAATYGDRFSTGHHAVVGLGPMWGGSRHQSLEALRFVCHGLSDDHPAHGAVLRLAVECTNAEQPFGEVAALVNQQMDIAIEAPVDTPAALQRLADSVYVAHLGLTKIKRSQKAQLRKKLAGRLTGMWFFEHRETYW